MPNTQHNNPPQTAKWKEPSTIVAALAAVVSVVALATSVRSCSVSEKALDLAVSEFQSNRALVLKGELGSDKDSFRLSPLDQAFLLQQVYFAFPKEIGGSFRPALPPDFVMPISSELYGLRKLIAKKVQPQAGTVKVALEARIPLLVESVAAVKGVLVKDKSLYALAFGFSVYENPDREPEIRPLGISFVRRLEAAQDGPQELEIAWKAVKG